MPQKCLVCIHPKRAHINRALMNPKCSLRDIAARYEISRSTLQRHKTHIKNAIVKAKKKEEVKTGQTAIEQFSAMLEEAESRYRKAKAAQKVQWFREWRSMLELAFKLGIEEQRQRERQVFSDVTPAVGEAIDGLLTAGEKEGEKEEE